MKKNAARAAAAAACTSVLLTLLAGCPLGPNPAETDTDGEETEIAVTLDKSLLTFATPDSSQTLSATVSGSETTTVTWSSSDTYIATVNAAGVVTSVSGGAATITAASTADSSKTAACQVTVGEPARTIAASYIDAATIDSGAISIIMCGDSLMRTYAANSADQCGWGQVLDLFLTEDAAVNNTLANGGRSSRSFYNEAGRWDQVKAILAAQAAATPTFVFIQFGHNDQKKTTDTNGADYLTFARTNQNGTVAGTYYDYLERYIVEARELGGIPILFTPFVREYLVGGAVTLTGEHNITAPYSGETSARGDYPAAMKEIAAKHDVPVVDLTAWSKTMVEANSASGTLGSIYISSDQTHTRTLGSLLMAREAIRALNAMGILTNYAESPAARVMLDSSTLSFGGIYTGNSLDKTFMISAFGDVSGTITITPPPGYTVSTDGAAFDSTAAISCDASYTGSRIFVRFAPTDTIAYNGDLTVAHTSIIPDYGNTAANATAGNITLTGNGKVPIIGAPAAAAWAMFSGTTIVLDAAIEGAISANTATLTGLRNKDVKNGAARFDSLDGSWPAESARNEGRYAQFTVPVTSGVFTLDTVSVDAGTGGGSNMKWEIVYSLASDFSSPTVLGGTPEAVVKDTLVTCSYPSIGINVSAGQTLYLRVYPYYTSAATGKSLMLANVVISGVTN